MGGELEMLNINEPNSLADITSMPAPLLKGGRRVSSFTFKNNGSGSQTNVKRGNVTGGSRITYGVHTRQRYAASRATYSSPDQ
ncbi:hypothetical protein GGI35DRAFT_314285 [Trichoderma velutinum]